MRNPAPAITLALLFPCAVAGAQTPVVHHARPHAATAKALACPAADPAPALPPGVPPAAGTVQTALALRYIDMQIGTGDAVTPGEFLTVHYTGWLASNGTKFDSSLDRGQPITFAQGSNRVIAGWDQGLSLIHI